MLTINTKAIVGRVGRIGLVRGMGLVRQVGQGRVLVAKGILNFELGTSCKLALAVEWNNCSKL